MKCHYCFARNFNSSVHTSHAHGYFTSGRYVESTGSILGNYNLVGMLSVDVSNCRILFWKEKKKLQSCTSSFSKEKNQKFSNKIHNFSQYSLLSNPAFHFKLSNCLKVRSAVDIAEHYWHHWSNTLLPNNWHKKEFLLKDPFFSNTCWTVEKHSPK